MTRSRLLFSALAAACLAGAAALSAAADRLVGAVSRGFGRLIAAWAEPFQPQVEPPSQEKPRLALVAARAFVARVLKRRPTVHPSWRMCPSI
jgi:hypothetical protein